MFKNLFKNEKTLNYLIYGVSFVITLVIMILLVRYAGVRDFFAAVENKTFDYRQRMIAGSGYKKPLKDIVIITIDDASYEYILDKYGEWPIPRNVYANIAEYIEKQNPTSIVYDLMFVKSMKSKASADEALVNTIANHDNIFTSMNFDNQSEDLRKPVKLDDKFSVNLKNESKHLDFNEFLIFSNCRPILSQILNSTSNIGMINVSRAEDGIIRKLPLFMIYQNKFYQHLALMAGIDYLNKTQNLKLDDKNFYVDKDSNLVLGKRKIQVQPDGSAILNWYGPSEHTYSYYPMYKLIKIVEGDKTIKPFDFSNKIVYVGTTAVSLYDTKSVPVDKLYPGVEMHATFINNLVDNNFIRTVNQNGEIVYAIVVALLVAFVVIKLNSTFASSMVALAIALTHITVAYGMMKYCNIWVSIVFPLLAILVIYIVALLVKYLIKSRDFEHQYKLATTDGLTELYNHRYFQDQMKLNIETAKRYNTQFSLIIVDIDHFKKFNDTYGHQAGDAVLRQVAQTLKRNVRSTDIVCRYGGEEMSIVLPNTNENEVFTTAQKVCDAVAEKMFQLNAEQESHVTISVGSSTYPQDGETPTRLIDIADGGLYYAKEHGRNQVGKKPTAKEFEEIKDKL